MELFENYDRRIDKINNTLKKYNIKDLQTEDKKCFF